MARMTPFDSPLLLGFDQIERMLDRAAKSGDGYPPYNIEQIGENRLRITLAVAGFSMSDLEVSLENNELVIRGRHACDPSPDMTPCQKPEPGAETPKRVFLHQGIAARQFQRNFVLAEGIEVTDATLEDGLLHVALIRETPEPEVRTIKIKSGAGRQAASAITLEGKKNR